MIIIEHSRENVFVNALKHYKAFVDVLQKKKIDIFEILLAG